VSTVEMVDDAASTDKCGITGRNCSVFSLSRGGIGGASEGPGTLEKRLIHKIRFEFRNTQFLFFSNSKSQAPSKVLFLFPKQNYEGVL
jgi:hypothetical protein